MLLKGNTESGADGGTGSAYRAGALVFAHGDVRAVCACGPVLDGGLLLWPSVRVGVDTRAVQRAR